MKLPIVQWLWLTTSIFYVAFLLERMHLFLQLRRELQVGNELSAPPVVVTSTDNNNNNNLVVVQIIRTRFMQFQPDLLSLGKARLKLFETFSLPTIISQTNQNFLWIIWTDPKLHHELKMELLRLVENTTNVLIVGANVYPEGFRNFSIASKSIWFGNQTLLIETKHRARHNNATVLETRLDADDGLGRTFVQDLQQKTDVETLSGWKVWCMGRHWEWHYFGSSKSGSVQSMYEPHCISTGLTWVYYGQDTSPSDRPTGNHMKIWDAVSECSDVRNSTNCWSLVSIPAIRARTPTSAGMKGITASMLTEEQQDHNMWNDLTTVFGLSRIQIDETRQYLHDHMPAILEDAIAGQCTKVGGTCKQSSRQQLQKLRQQNLTQRKAD